jgi:hypothetical protein
MVAAAPSPGPTLHPDPRFTRTHASPGPTLHPNPPLSGPPVGERIGPTRWGAAGFPQPPPVTTPTGARHGLDPPAEPDGLGDLAGELVDGVVGHLDVDGGAVAWG